MAKKVKTRDKKIKFIKQKINISNNRLVELKSKIVSALMSGDIEKNQKANEEFNSEINYVRELEERLSKLNNEISQNNMKIESLKTYIPIWSKEFENASLTVKRQILDKLIDKVYLYNDKVEITTKYPIYTNIIGEKI